MLYRLRAASLCLFCCCLLVSGPYGYAAELSSDDVPAAPRIRGQRMGSSCAGDGMVFLVMPPEGWVNDKDTAVKFGVCSMHVEEGRSFDDAPAVMYARVQRKARGAGLEAAADAVVAATLDTMTRQEKGALPRVSRVRPSNPDHRGMFTMRLFDNGPKPNEFEAGAYRVEGNNVFFIILSARDVESRDAALPYLEEVMERVIVAVRQRK